MKVEAHAFLSEALYESSEEGAWQQIMARRLVTRGSSAPT